MLGLLLSKAGVRVLVLEKHADFLRDFRGDTIHPSTLQVMHELGLLDRLLKLPHQKVPRLSGQFGNRRFQLADFSHLPVAAAYIAMMPQWDFLKFLAEEAARASEFRLLMGVEAVGLVEDNGRVIGVKAQSDAGGEQGDMTFHADLVVAADGRHSTLRSSAGLAVRDLGAPMDVLWLRLSRHDSDCDDSMGRFDAGSVFVTINRGSYWQCAFVIAKGSAEEVKAAGLEAFRARLARVLPFDPARTAEITDWDAVKLLTVAVDRLEQWHRPGLLVIGDAAHAMSPVGGVGINLAIQDAVAAANILARPLREGWANTDHLAGVEARRRFPTRATQALQIAVQNRIIARTLAGSARPMSPPLALRLLDTVPLLRRIPARLMGLGLRPADLRAGFATT
jgi:2-polyprenyl-6-methoxyphenol hydroxylase-like FAD-dependent oxidoreductase